MKDQTVDEVECKECGENIPAGRLALFPKARFCVDCITSGLVPEEVFAYRGRVVIDEEGNTHMDVVSSQKDWEQIQRDEVSLGKGE